MPPEKTPLVRRHSRALNLRACAAMLVAGVLLCSGVDASARQASARQASDEQPAAELGADAIVIAADSFARSQVVALGRDLLVRGTVSENASVLRGNAVVSGSIGGDLIVLEGSARLEDGALIRGDVVVVGGAVEMIGSARVEGRTLAYPNASGALLGMLEIPSLGGRPVALGAKLGLLLAWWLAGAVLVTLFARPMHATSGAIAQHPMSNFFQGLTFVLASALGFILLSAVSPAMISLPLLVLVVLLAFVLKVWGSVAVVLLVGRTLAKKLHNRPGDALGQFLLGLALLGAIKLVPWLGAIVWSSITLVGMGATLRTAVARSD